MSKYERKATKILKYARKLLEAGWTQHCSACNAQNKPVKTDDPSACKFCLLGAVMWASIDDKVYRDKAFDFLYDALPNQEHRSIVDFNDAASRTKDEVLSCIDKAIAASCA